MDTFHTTLVISLGVGATVCALLALREAGHRIDADVDRVLRREDPAVEADIDALLDATREDRDRWQPDPESRWP